MLRSNTTPQDYFDYINDNEFTPLTSSEFAASLQERPPTYIESERIEQSESEGNRDSNVETVIPRVPPPPQPHTLPSLTRLRVVQLENISSRADEARSLQQSTSGSESSAASGGTETTDVSNNLIDLTEHQSSDDFPDDNPLYS